MKRASNLTSDTLVRRKIRRKIHSSGDYLRIEENLKGEDIMSLRTKTSTESEGAPDSEMDRQLRRRDTFFTTNIGDRQIKSATGTRGKGATFCAEAQCPEPLYSQEFIDDSFSKPKLINMGTASEAKHSQERIEEVSDLASQPEPRESKIALQPEYSNEEVVGISRKYGDSSRAVKQDTAGRLKDVVWGVEDVEEDDEDEEPLPDVSAKASTRDRDQWSTWQPLPPSSNNSDSDDDYSGVFAQEDNYKQAK